MELSKAELEAVDNILRHTKLADLRVCLATALRAARRQALADAAQVAERAIDKPLTIAANTAGLGGLAEDVVELVALGIAADIRALKG